MLSTWMNIRACILLCIVNSYSVLSLTQKQCRTYDQVTLTKEVLALRNEVEKSLMQNTFVRKSTGASNLLVSPSDGEDNGGISNPFGSYIEFFANSEEVFPPGVCESFPSPSNHSVLCKKNMQAGYFLGPSDALVYVGCTPPPVEYFGYESTICAQMIDSKGNITFPAMNFGDPISIKRMGSLANHIDRDSEGDVHDDIYDQPVVVINTADQGVADAVRKAYVQAGIPESSIFIRWIPSSTVRLWDRSEGKTWEDTLPDILCDQHRVVIPKENSVNAVNAFTKLTWPMTVYYADDDKKPQLAPDPVVISRESDALPDETKLYSGMLDKLRESIISEFEAERKGRFVGTVASNYTIFPMYDDWNKCLSMTSECSHWCFPTRDCTYGMPGYSTSHLPLTSRTTAVLIGVDHKLAMNATYNAVGLDVAYPNPNGTESFAESLWFLSDDLRGSAGKYLPNLSDSSFFYATTFAQPGMCGDEQPCTEFQAEDTDKGYWLGLGERVYSVAATSVGPDANKMLAAQLIVFESL